MASFKLSFMVVQKLPNSHGLSDMVEEFGRPEASDFGVLSGVANSNTAEATIFKLKTRSVKSVNEQGGVDVSDVNDLKIIRFKTWPDTDRVEVYTGSAADRVDLIEFFDELGLETTHITPSLNLLNAVKNLMPAEDLKIVRIAGNEYLGEGKADGEFVAKFEAIDEALDLLEKELEHVTAVKVSFRAMSGRATITMTPDGCFGITCKEDDMHQLFDRCRELVRVAEHKE